MSTNVKPVPEGYHTVTPALNIRDAAAAIEFYQRALGATESFRMAGPGGSVAHAELRIGDSTVMVADANPQWGNRSPEDLGGTPVSIFLYVEDVDAAVQRAEAAGATVCMPPADMFWGDRFAKIRDPFGHEWSIATHVEDVAPEEMERRGREWMAQMAGG